MQTIACIDILSGLCKNDALEIHLHTLPNIYRAKMLFLYPVSSIEHILILNAVK